MKPVSSSNVRRILFALSLILAVATNASAFETPLAGDWTLAGKDAKGSYTGTATVTRVDDGKYSISVIAFERLQITD